MTTKFEPHQLPDGEWLCPCQDAYGTQAVLRKNLDADRAVDLNIANYSCDQNGDRWQQLAGPDGTCTWHYLGRLS